MVLRHPTADARWALRSTSFADAGKRTSCIVYVRKGMLEGDMEGGYVSVGHAISFIHEIKPAAQIIADMTKDWGNPA